MSTTKSLVKQAYGEHFDRLKQIANEVERLSSIIPGISDPEIRKQIQQHVSALKSELKEYAENLEARGVQLFENAA